MADDRRYGMRCRLVVCLLALATIPTAGYTAAAQDIPNFADYPGDPVFAGRNAAPVLATREARRFRTMIRDGARGKPNFNGHYVVANWGCGTDCEMGAIIDAISGRVISLPVVAGSPEDAAWDSTHFAYRRESRLLVMHGMIAEEPPMGSHYFVFDGKRLRHLKTIVKPQKHQDAPPAEKPQ